MLRYYRLLQFGLLLPSAVHSTHFFSSFPSTLGPIFFSLVDWDSVSSQDWGTVIEGVEVFPYWAFPLSLATSPMSTPAYGKNQLLAPARFESRKTPMIWKFIFFAIATSLRSSFVDRAFCSNRAVRLRFDIIRGPYMLEPFAWLLLNPASTVEYNSFVSINIIWQGDILRIARSLWGNNPFVSLGDCALWKISNSIFMSSQFELVRIHIYPILIISVLLRAISTTKSVTLQMVHTCILWNKCEEILPMAKSRYAPDIHRLFKDDVLSYRRYRQRCAMRIYRSIH